MTTFIKKWEDEFRAIYELGGRIRDFEGDLRRDAVLELKHFIFTDYTTALLDEVERICRGMNMGYYIPKNETGIELNNILPERLGAMSYNSALQDIITKIKEIK